MSDEAEIEAGSWQQEAGLDGDANFEKFESVSDLAKSYSEAQGMISRSVRFPTEDASPERVSEFRERILAADDSFMLRPEGYASAPETADSYKFDAVDGANIDPETEGAFKAVAHGLGLNEKQASGVHDWLSSNIAEANTDTTKINDAGMAELKGQWGNATDEKLAEAKNTVAILADKIPDLPNMLDNLAGIGHDATGIKLMSMVAEMLGEAGAVPSTHRSQLSPEDASNQLVELREKYAGIEEGHPSWETYRGKELALRKAGGRMMNYNQYE